MTPTRTEITAYGQREIVDITIVDGSKKANDTEQVSAKLAIFFDATDRGEALLKSMLDASAAHTPLAFYGLTCIPQRDGTCEFKTGQSFLWDIAKGNYNKLLGW